MESGRWRQSVAWGPTVLRVIVGFIFVMYGWDKFFGSGLDFWADLFVSQGIPASSLAATLVGVVELVGGIALVLGLFTRVAATLLAIDMAVAILVVGLDGGFFVWDNGVSFPLALFAATVALALMGPGEASVDEILAGRRSASA
jgi:putative oxidoreductase